jgi:hypothetical protein
MSGANTNNFDLVVQMTEGAINTGLEMIPAGQFPFPSQAPVQLNVQGVNVPVPYLARLELERPRITLDPAANEVQVFSDLGEGSVLFLNQTPAPPGANLFSQIPLEGVVEFACPLVVASAGDFWADPPEIGQSAVAQLTNANVTTAFTVADVVVGTVPIVNTPITIPGGTLASLLQGAFTDLADDLGDLALTRPVRLHNGPTAAQRAADVQARILGPVAGPALGVGVLSEASQALNVQPNISQMVQDANLAGGLMRVANLWLVQLICEAISNSPGFAGVTFTMQQNPPRGVFQGEVTVEPPESDAFVLTRMTVDIVAGGGISIVGKGKMSDWCWDASIDFSMTINFICDPATGGLAPVSPGVDVDTDVDKSIWCAIIAVIVGIVVGAVGGVGAGILAGVLLYVILLGPTGLAPDLPSVGSVTGLLDRFGGLRLPVPLGSVGLDVGSCNFDDLAVRGSLVFADRAPRAASGSRTLHLNVGFDLDKGQATLFGSWPWYVDLVWTGTELRAVNGCELEVLNASLSSLTLSDLQALTYGGSTIPASQIPILLNLAGGNGWRIPGRLLQPLVFAARTTDGLYAKCSVLQSADGETLHLTFETYAGPRIRLSLEATVETTNQTVVGQGLEDCGPWIKVDPRLPLGILDLFDRWHPPVPPFELPEPIPIPPGPGPIPYLPGRGPRRLPRTMREPARPTMARGGTSHGHMAHMARIPRRAAASFHPMSLPEIIDLLTGHRQCEGEHVVHGDKRVPWVQIQRAQHVRVRAHPEFFDAPLNFAWSLFATTVPAGSGNVVINGVTVTYDDTSPVLDIDAPLGTDIVGQVCVVITDADGRRCEACVGLDQPSTVKVGGCDSCPEPTTLATFLPQAEQHAARWAGAAAAAGRMRALAAFARPQGVPGIIPLRRALKEAARMRDDGQKKRRRKA